MGFCTIGPKPLNIGVVTQKNSIGSQRIRAGVYKCGIEGCYEDDPKDNISSQNSIKKAKKKETLELSGFFDRMEIEEGVEEEEMEG